MYALVEDGTIQDTAEEAQLLTDVALGDSGSSMRSVGVYPIYERDPGPTTHPDVDVPREVEDGTTLEIDQQTQTVYRHVQRKTRSLEEYKDALREHLRSLRVKHARKPVSYDGNDFDADPQAQQKLTGKLTYAQATGKDTDSTWSVGWKTAGNDFVQLSYSDLSAVVEAVNNQVQAAYNNEAQLLPQIEGATTISDLDAIDLTSGWP